jgi:hypothetical protein
MNDASRPSGALHPAKTCQARTSTAQDDRPGVGESREAVLPWRHGVNDESAVCGAESSEARHGDRCTNRGSVAMWLFGRGCCRRPRDRDLDVQAVAAVRGNNSVLGRRVVDNDLVVVKPAFGVTIVRSMRAAAGFGPGVQTAGSILGQAQKQRGRVPGQKLGDQEQRGQERASHPTVSK